MEKCNHSKLDYKKLNAYYYHSHDSVITNFLKTYWKGEQLIWSYFALCKYNEQ